MTTAYFTFGQAHEHIINGQIFNKDTVVKITAEDPRKVMFKTFGPKWGFQYNEEPDMNYFPGGVVELPNV